MLERPVTALARAVSRNVSEIRNDRALTFYGAALAIAHIVTFAEWKFRRGVPLMIGRGAASLCWPFWNSCHAYQLPTSVVNDGLWIYLLLAIVAACGFVSRRVGIGYSLLVLVSAISVFVMLQDYRLRANQHYMLNCMAVTFLFLPYKRALLHHVLAFLYFWAGALKLDRDWLSGMTLYSQDRLWFPVALVPAACAYVIVLEMGMIWGIYSRRAWIFWATLAQLLLFHVTSWPIVGFWYPMLMFCLLAILPLSRLLHPPAERVRRFWREPYPQFAVSTAFVVLFALLQMVPRAFPGDSAVTGEGRVFALHMFDAQVECSATMTYHRAGAGDVVDARKETTTLPHRSRCDPVIYYALARNQCERIAAGLPVGSRVGVAQDLDLRLRAKRTSSATYTQVLDIQNFCAANPQYSLLHHNSWIGIAARPPSLAALLWPRRVNGGH